MNFRIKQPPALPTRTASLLRWSRYPFLIMGILALGYVGYVLLDTWLFQTVQTWRFERALKDPPASAPTLPRDGILSPQSPGWDVAQSS